LEIHARNIAKIPKMATDAINYDRGNIMNMSNRLHNLASVSTGTARAVYESAYAAYHAIFEGEEDGELAELNELGNEIGGDLGGENGGMPTDNGGMPTDDGSMPPEDGGNAPDDGGMPPEDGGAPEDGGDTPEEPADEEEPKNVNAQPQAASINADALIAELTKLKYPEKIREVGQQMKQTAGGKAPTAQDMVKPVAAAISKYMSKKGYAAMQKEDALRVVKTIIMAATDVGKKAEEAKSKTADAEQPQGEQ
jgi:hypothetical protein